MCACICVHVEKDTIARYLSDKSTNDSTIFTWDFPINQIEKILS